MSDHIEVKDGKVIEVAADGAVIAEKNLGRVISGLNSTLKSDRTSESAKSQAEARILEIENLRTGHKHHHPSTAPAKAKKGGIEPEVEDEEHLHRRIGGMKAAIKNPNVGEEKKEELRKKLDEQNVEHE